MLLTPDFQSLAWDRIKPAVYVKTMCPLDGVSL